MLKNWSPRTGCLCPLKFQSHCQATVLCLHNGGQIQNTSSESTKTGLFFFHATPLIIVFSFIKHLFEVIFYVLPLALVGAGGQLVARNYLLEIKCANSHNLGAKTFNIVNKEIRFFGPTYLLTRQLFAFEVGRSIGHWFEASWHNWLWETTSLTLLI